MAGQVEVNREQLLTEVTRWKKRTNWFRHFNLGLMGLFKVGIPLGSIIVSICLFAAAQGKPLFNPIATLAVAGTVTLFSGLDTALNPTARKREAFRKHNALVHLQLSVQSTPQKNVDEESSFVLSSSGQLKAILDDYVEHGY